MSALIAELRETIRIGLRVAVRIGQKMKLMSNQEIPWGEMMEVKMQPTVTKWGRFINRMVIALLRFCLTSSLSSDLKIQS